MAKKIKQFVLTCAESKEYNKCGTTMHAYGGLGYHITNVDGVPTVTSITPLDPDAVEYEVIVRR